MRKTITLILSTVLMALPILVEAQQDTEWSFNSASFLTGETSLTKGNMLEASFTKDNSSLVFHYNRDLSEAIYFRHLGDHVFIGGSGGFYLNVPWFGPIATTSFFGGTVRTMHWIGWSTGNPETGTTSTEMLFCFSYQESSVHYKGFKGYYALQHYQTFPAEHIVSVQQSLGLGHGISVFAGAGRKIRAEEFIFSMGIALDWNAFKDSLTQKIINNESERQLQSF